MMRQSGRLCVSFARLEVAEVPPATSLALDRGPLRRRYNCGKAGIESGEPVGAP